MNQEQKIKLLQRLVGAILGVIILLLCFFMVKFFDDAPRLSKKKQDVSEKTFDTAVGRIDFQEIWKSEMEERDQQTQAQIKALEALIKNQQKEDEGRLDEIHNLINAIAFEKNKAPTEPDQSVDPKIKDEQSKIAKLTLNLTKQEDESLTTVDNTIPAGSFAEAVLLSGVDATAAVKAGSNPRPMLLRLIDLTVLPRRFRSDLVDCHCTASAWGELSSERIHARLVKLSCVERDSGEILEVEVNGFIAGSDGKEGVRGVVVSKEGKFLTRSLWGGVFAGIGSTLSPANRAAQGGPFLTIGKPEQMTPGDMFKSGFGESANTSLNQLSKYYIDRAEQIQPVIQISAGQKVDLVFTEGVEIDKTLIRKKMAERNDDERKKNIEP